MVCFTAVDDSQGLFLEFLDEYCHASHAFIFDHIQYNVFTGLLIFVMSKVTTFTWNFVDLFLMLVSTGLAERFKQFNAVVIEADVSVSQPRRAPAVRGVGSTGIHYCVAVAGCSQDVAPHSWT